MTDDVDVVVTDGFTGNVALKTLEGGMRALVDAVLGGVRRPTRPRRRPRSLMPALLPLYGQLDPDNTGGAMLLGVDGVCIISHGSSSATAIVNAVRVGRRRWSTATLVGIRARRHRRSEASAWTGASVAFTSGQACGAGTLRPPSTAARRGVRRARRDPRRAGPDRPPGGLRAVRDRLADILEIEPSTINEGDSFADDLDADSLALIELVEALEEELGERTVGFRIDDEDLEDLKTVRDAVDYVHGRSRTELIPGLRASSDASRAARAPVRRPRAPRRAP